MIFDVPTDLSGFGLALAMGRDGWPGLRKCLDLRRALKVGENKQLGHEKNDIMKLPNCWCVDY